MPERYNNVDTSRLFADGGWQPDQTPPPLADPHAETQNLNAIHIPDFEHTAPLPRTEATQQLPTIEPLIPTRAIEEEASLPIGNRKAGRVPLALAGIGIAGLLGVGVASVLVIENNKTTEAKSDPAPSASPTPATTRSSATPSATVSPSPTKIEAVEKVAASPSPVPDKSSASPSTKPSPSPSVSSSPSATASEAPSPSPTPEACQWLMSGATVTVGECGDAIAYDEATGDASFELTRGMAFDAQCIAGSRVQIVIANSVDYVNPGYFDTSSLPHC